MPTELETGLPSIRQIQTLTREGTEVEIKTVTGEILPGKIRWQDPYCICIVDPYDQPTIVWRQAIVYLKHRA
jgi:host factor-I protein